MVLETHTLNMSEKLKIIWELSKPLLNNSWVKAEVLRKLKTILKH